MGHERHDVDDLGHITINMNPKAMSLDAHCATCCAAVNRKFVEHARFGNKHAQGRPMGGLLAWLKLRCTGDAERHHALYVSHILLFDKRVEAREWGHTLGTLAACFASERDPFGHEALEPVCLG